MDTCGHILTYVCGSAVHTKWIALTELRSTSLPNIALLGIVLCNYKVRRFENV